MAYPIPLPQGINLNNLSNIELAVLHNSIVLTLRNLLLEDTEREIIEVQHESIKLLLTSKNVLVEDDVLLDITNLTSVV